MLAYLLPAPFPGRYAGAGPSTAVPGTGVSTEEEQQELRLANFLLAVAKRVQEAAPAGASAAGPSTSAHTAAAAAAAGGGRTRQQRAAAVAAAAAAPPGVFGGSRAGQGGAGWAAGRRPALPRQVSAAACPE